MQANNLETKLKIIDAYRKSEKRDRLKILTRKNVIENRKEKLEIISKERVSGVCRAVRQVHWIGPDCYRVLFSNTGCQTGPILFCVYNKVHAASAVM